MNRRLALAVTLALALGVAQSPVRAGSWPMQDVRTSLSFNRSLLRDLGLELDAVERAEPKRSAHALASSYGERMVFSGENDKRMAVDVQGHVLEHVLGPGVRHKGGFDLNWRGGALSLQGFVLAPAFAPRTFELRARDGEVAFTADFAHFEVDRDAGRLQLFNLDLRVSPQLAARLARPELAGVAVGTLEIDARVQVPPAEAKLGTPPACGDWSGQKDVMLTNIGSVGQWERANGFVAISPSATLRNAGTGNVPWYGKFTGPFPPYNNDQHPFLVWNLYRSANGVFEQIGTSDVKHAFLTINSGCDAGACTDSHILGLGCSDVYGEGTNNSTGSLSFRPEITAGAGLWNHTGSHFDQNGDGVQDHFGSDPFPIHRAAVLETDLQTAGAQYFFEAWYVVREDINIFNSMGWRRITPSFGGSSWTFALNTGLNHGSALDAWVSPSPPAGSLNTLLTLPEGHVRLAVKTTDLGGGQTRYEYALMNHDFDRQIGSFFVPTQGVSVTNLSFGDIDSNAGNDWTVTQDASGVTWTKVGAQGLDWGTLFNFGFTATSVPVATSASAAAVEAGSPATLTLATLAPGAPSTIYADGFE
jgi:hypothetical protein